LTSNNRRARTPKVRAQFAAVLAALATLLMAAGLVTLTSSAASATDSNQSDYWETLPGEQCQKVDDQGAESGGYTITADPMEGFVYSKIIIKKGSGSSQGEENTVIANPVKGETYYHLSGNGYSHVILCQVPEVEESPSESVDVCPNIEGPQETVPEGYELVDGECVPVEESPSESVDVCPNLQGAQETVPEGYQLVNGQCTKKPEVKGTETIKPKPSKHPVGQPTVLGTQAVVPTAVDAGLATMPTQHADSSRSLLAQGMVGGGLLLLVASGWLLLGRRSHGVHEA
jgi:hypothetical protein